MLLLEIAGGMLLAMVLAANWAVVWRFGLLAIVWGGLGLLAYVLFTLPT